MNQADVGKLVSKLRIHVPVKHRRLPNPEGPKGRIDKLRKTVTGLIKFERIELSYNRADESRQYAERLISEAIRYGDCHKPTMEIADFWLLEKQLVHKLFKVLVPRFQDMNNSFTVLYRAPDGKDLRNPQRAVLELRDNPYPPLFNRKFSNKNYLPNILLDAAKYEYRQSKYSEIANKIGKEEESANSSKNIES